MMDALGSELCVGYNMGLGNWILSQHERKKEICFSNIKCRNKFAKRKKEIATFLIHLSCEESGQGHGQWGCNLI